MMLAELYATQFHDLAEADRTVRGICEQSNITPLQVSMALHRLADWHLKLDDNPVAARRALAEICHRFPNTHFASEAQIEFDKLPQTREQWVEQKKPKPIRLPPLSGPLEEPLGQPGPALNRSDALAL